MIGQKEAGGEEPSSIHLVFLAILVHTTTLLDGDTHSAFLHKAIVAHTAWRTGLTLVAAWGTVQV